MFNNEGTEVALILKNKPADQVGLYNGIGGKIENLEHSEDAMPREFLEETGIEAVNGNTKATQLWKKSVYLQGEGWQVHYFRAFSTDIIEALKAKTEWPTSEPVHVYAVKDLPENLYTHVAWTLFMSLAPVQFPVRVDDPGVE